MALYLKPILVFILIFFFRIILKLVAIQLHCSIMILIEDFRPSKKFQIVNLLEFCQY